MILRSNEIVDNFYASSVSRDLCLCQGCLTPVTFIIPPRSILSPDGDAAVVGGNVLTSQRLCDVILQAFEACACSQGCMNNFLFGDGTFGYYETIAGGRANNIEYIPF